MNTLATLSLKHIKDILSDGQLTHISMENNEEIIDFEFSTKKLGIKK